MTFDADGVTYSIERNPTNKYLLDEIESSKLAKETAKTVVSSVFTILGIPGGGLLEVFWDFLFLLLLNPTYFRKSRILLKVL